MDVISSKDNQTIKDIRKLKEKKYRDLNGEYIIEGIKLIEEAINEKVEIVTIIICEDCVKNETIEQKLLYEIAKYNCIYVTQNVFDTITDVLNPQGIVAVVKMKEQSNNQIKYDEDIIVVLDDIQDPGNLGTILRTLDSINLKQIIISNKTADCYNPKVVRSTMGAIFRLNIIKCENLIDTLKTIQKQKYQLVATSLEADKNIYQIDYIKKAIIIGNESNGVSKEILKMVNCKVKIPMLGKTESLNASVAAGIILYEYVRQKMCN